MIGKEEIKSLTLSIKGKALKLGFDLIGISPIAEFPENQKYKEWLSKGYEGEMYYMARDPEKRADVRNTVPSAKSVISCVVNYNTDVPYSMEFEDNKRGWISRYAWGEDYHDVIRGKLKLLLDHINEMLPEGFNHRFYVDTGPVLEKVFAKYSGIGWIGKNTCLINQDIGSWIFVGEIITDLELEYDNPAVDRCGTCTRCLDSCPTNAFPEPYVIDSNRCISYLTIELKGDISPALRDGMGNNIFGCDICQDVCPWNKKAEVKNNKEFIPRDGLINPLLSELLDLDEEEFRNKFKKSPIKRAKRKGFLRNVLIAMGNSGDNDNIPRLKKFLQKEKEPLLKRHAMWAISKISGEDFVE